MTVKTITIDFIDSNKLTVEHRSKIFDLYFKVIMPSANKVRYFFLKEDNYLFVANLFSSLDIEFSTLTIE
jgi:hypothetical protein